MKWLIMYLVSLAVVGIAAAAPCWADRVIVNLMRSLRIFVFPDPMRLAVSLQRDTGEW